MGLASRVADVLRPIRTETSHLVRGNGIKEPILILSGFGLLFLGFSTLLAIHGITGSESVAPDKLLTPHNTTAAVTHEISRMDNPRPTVRKRDPLSI